MALEAVLTLGWPDSPEGALTAQALHAESQDAEGGSVDRSKLGAKLGGAGSEVEIHALSRLFRKRPRGFKPLSQLMGALAAVDSEDPSGRTIRCHVDAFAYAFLKGAKNIDLVLPESQSVRGSFRNRVDVLRQQVDALEAFERTGTKPPGHLSLSVASYLSLRGILARPTARDERRLLATLLVNGPSNMADVSKDLGLHYDLSQRLTKALIESGAIEARGDRFAISEEGLPLVVFALREIMGLDYLSLIA